MTVILGKNRFVDCRAIMGFGGRGLLSVLGPPLVVELSLPPEVTNASNPPTFKTVRSDDVFGIFIGEDAIVIATRLAPDSVHLKVDLRAVGMNIYDDVAGLHVGGSTFAGNEIVKAAFGINLN